MTAGREMTPTELLAAYEKAAERLAVVRFYPRLALDRSLARAALSASPSQPSLDVERLAEIHWWLVLHVNSTDERYLTLLDWLEPLIPNDVADRVDARLSEAAEKETPGTDSRPPKPPRPVCRTPGCENLRVSELTAWCRDHIDDPPELRAPSEAAVPGEPEEEGT